MDALALLVGQKWGRGLLDQLLEAALQRAVARAHHHDVAVLVGEHLGLHVAGLIQIALNEALAAAEGGGGLAGGGFEQLRDLLAGVGDLHAAPAAAEGCLDGHRQAVLVSERKDLLGAGHRVLRARCHRGVGRLGDVTGGDLVTERGDRGRRGADPGQAGVDDALGEVGVFGQEAVAGVDGVRAGLRRGVEKLVHVQVGLRRRGTAEGESLVGERDEGGILVRLRVDGNGGNARVFGRADHADGNLAAVGHQHLRQRVAQVLGDSGRSVV